MAEKTLDIKYINKWTGYKNYKDVTSLLPTDLSVGSQNIIIRDGAKLETRGGSRFFGAQGTVGVNTNSSWTLAHRIHSDYDRFVNNQGIIMPFRVFYSGTSAKGDVLECWLPEFIAGVPQTTKKWYQVTPNAPASPIISQHKWYWAEWYDPLNVQNRIVFTYGSTTIGSYSGGYAPVTSVGANSITTNGTWRSKGFIEAPEGVNSVVINGVTYALSAGDFSTNTITVASTAGVSVNDVAFQSLNFDAASFGTADVCSSINNQVYYIDWTQRNVFISWNRNRTAYLGDTIYTGTSGLDDAVFSGTFTGTTTDTYIVSIDSVGIDTQTYSAGGTGGLNDARYDTSSYSGTVNVKNIYKTLIVADFTILVPSAGGSYTAGEVVKGGTSNATGIFIGYVVNGSDDQMAIKMLSGSFQSGETITGLTSTTAKTSSSCIYQSWIQFYKNEIIQTITSGPVTATLVPIFSAVTLSLVDSLTITFGNYYGHACGDFWELTIQNPKVDTFSWSINGTNQATKVAITGSAQTLSNGISVNFVRTTGHNIGDSWRIVAYPKVEKGWRDFYNTFPVRLPGEGFKLQLESNGWAMNPQESQMYICGQAGEYYRVDIQLSADLQSETIRTVRLKSEPQKKALYPYLMSYNNDYMSIVSQEKTWDILGRQKFLELPQVRSLSDTIKYDFYAVDWEDANIRYLKRNQFFVVPRTGVIFMYDDFMKYWHTPMFFGRRISSIGFIDGKIVGHSYERNETYELFTEDKNDLGEYAIKTNITTSYFDYGKRFNHKETSSIAMDGYIEGAPQINWKVNFGVGGCNGIESGIVDPVICYPKDTASLGKSSLGFHGLGNSPTNVIPHFTFAKTYNNSNYYLRNIELSSDSIEQRWAITSLGNDVEYNTVSNADIFNTENPY